MGFRSAVGLGIPLLVGQASGHPLIGAVAATGALTGGLASLQGTYRSRAAVVMAATFLFAVCVQGMLALHAQIPIDGPGCPPLSRLASEFDTAMHTVAVQLRSGSGGPLPPLRSTQLEAARLLGVDGADGDRTKPLVPRAVLLVGETDLMVNSANTLGHLVGVSGP